MTRADLQRSLLFFLESGPHHTKQLAKWLEISRDEARSELRDLRAAGQVVQLQDLTWSLPKAEGHVGRPRAFTASTAIEKMCTRCHQRYARSRGGLCRRCEHETGIPVPSVFEQDAARLARQQALIPRGPADTVRDGGIRTIVVGGIEYDALSVGSAPVTGDYHTGSPLNGYHAIPSELIMRPR
jgi:predicted ArsR family transcriptional regulator